MPPTPDIDELVDPTYREASQIRKRARLQAAILGGFKKRWCHEYLTSLREYHKASGNNQRRVKKGDVVIVHDDTPRATWKMAVVEDLTVGKDSLVRAATIRTANGTTTRPITKLYPMELNETDEKKLGVEKSPTVADPDLTITDPDDARDEQTTDPDDSRDEYSRPQRVSARKATDPVKEWIRSLSAPRGCEL